MPEQACGPAEVTQHLTKECQPYAKETTFCTVLDSGLGLLSLYSSPLRWLVKGLLVCNYWSQIIKALTGKEESCLQPRRGKAESGLLDCRALMAHQTHTIIRL